MKPILLKSNIVAAACNLLNCLSVPFSKDYVESFIKEQKDFPSLLSVSALLDDFNIENVPVHISLEQLIEMPLPAIAHLDTGDGEKFVVIHEPITSGRVFYIDSKDGIVQEDIGYFRSRWKGVLLLAKPDIGSRSRGIAHQFAHRFC